MVSVRWGVALAATIGAACGATAQDLPFYIGASYGAAFVDGTASTSNRAVLDEEGRIAALPLGGLPFDDDDGSWSAFVGYQIHRYVALEAGYSDLGSHESEARFAIVGQPEVPLPQIEMESLYVAARFRYPLTDSVSATWHAGVSETSFEADGSAVVAGLIQPGPILGGNRGPVLGPIFGPLPNPNVQLVPFDDPDDEIGFRYGFGFDWRFAPRASVELEYSRHDVKVLTLDSVNLRLMFHLAERRN